MMKVVTPKEMVRLETLAYDEGASEEEFMDQAGKGVAEIILELHKEFSLSSVVLLCGKGNNAGDAYAAGTYLLQQNVSVLAISAPELKHCSPLCRSNSKRFKEAGGSILQWGEEAKQQIAESDLLVDGLFGTGFHGIAREPYREIIEASNASHSPLFAIDIPSGLDGETGLIEGPCMIANCTIFLGLPKQGFFLGGGWDVVGTMQQVDFGLDEKYLNHAESLFSIMTPEDIPLLPEINPSRHKYQAGSVCAVAGSPGMPGAALLSSKAALRSGAGIVHLFHPKGMEQELSSAPYELIRVPYEFDDLTPLIDRLHQSKAALLGPGIGVDENALNLVTTILEQVQHPIVIDADALTIIGEHHLSLPSPAICTPHRGEMARLLGGSTPNSLDNQWISKCRQYADRTGALILLKGGPSFLFQKDHEPLILPWGNPGMATAGCGDVLTGILAALLSQGLTPREACLLGSFLHGASGDFAAYDLSAYSLMASDLIDTLPEVFKYLEN